MSYVHKRMKSWGGGGAQGSNRVQNSSKVFGQSRISDEGPGLAVSCGIHTNTPDTKYSGAEERGGSTANQSA